MSVFYMFLKFFIAKIVFSTFKVTLSGIKVFYLEIVISIVELAK